MTPIDWKPTVNRVDGELFNVSHHSLMTPIDWKPRRLTSNAAATLIPCHHSLMTPIDWKPERLLDALNDAVTTSPLADGTY